MIRYRLVLMPLRKPKGRWRDTRREALEDAIAQGLGERDEHDRKRVWLHALAEIESQEEPVSDPESTSTAAAPTQ